MSQEPVAMILGVPVTYAQREILATAVASLSFAGRYRLPTSRGSATTECLGKRGLVEWVALKPEDAKSRRVILLTTLGEEIAAASRVQPVGV